MKAPFNQSGTTFSQWAFNLEATGLQIFLYRNDDFLPAIYIQLGNNFPLLNDTFTTLHIIDVDPGVALSYVPITNETINFIYAWIISTPEVSMPITVVLTNPLQPVIMNGKGEQVPYTVTQPVSFEIEELHPSFAELAQALQQMTNQANGIVDEIAAPLTEEQINQVMEFNPPIDGDFFAPEGVETVNPAVLLQEIMANGMPGVAKQDKIVEKTDSKTAYKQPIKPIYDMYKIPILNAGSDQFDYATNNPSPNFLDDHGISSYLSWSNNFVRFYNAQSPWRYMDFLPDYMNLVINERCYSREKLLSEKLMSKEDIANVDILRKLNPYAQDKTTWAFFAGDYDDLVKLLIHFFEHHLLAPAFLREHIAICFVDLAFGMGFAIENENGIILFYSYKAGQILNKYNNTDHKLDIPEYVDAETKERMYLSMLRTHNILSHFVQTAAQHHVGHLIDAFSTAKEALDGEKMKSNSVIELVNPYTWS